MDYTAIWNERKFHFVLEPEQFPAVIERLRATPPAITELVKDIPSNELTNKNGDKFSVQENVGHLALVEYLVLARIEDYKQGKETLSIADMNNLPKIEFDMNFNARDINDVLNDFRMMRGRSLELFDAMTKEDVIKTAMHPRLKIPSRMIDHAYFFAEHDIHHMAKITTLLKNM